LQLVLVMTTIKVNNTSRAATGIDNSGTIDTGEGNDAILVSSESVWSIFNLGTISTGGGDDTIQCLSSNEAGIYNSVGSKIDTGTGRDLITATAQNQGIDNDGIIDTGDGGSTIIGQALAIGNGGTTANNPDNYISGVGIKNAGTIVTGDQSDYINGVGGSFGIYNTSEGSISSGLGDDVITGRSTGGSNGVGIFNNGSISTGAGADVIDALTGGFSGNGKIHLGSGNDSLKGFGTGYFNGGNGKDYLIFGAGTYTVRSLGIGSEYYVITQGTTSMSVKDFEFIGNSSNPSNVFEFINLIDRGPFVIA
jgi:hypothetical protein